MTNIDTDNEQGQIRSARLMKLKHFREKNLEPYPYKFEKTHSAEEVLSQFSNLEKGEESGVFISVAGRIMSIRNSGMFIDIYDPSGKIQIFSSDKTLSEDNIFVLKSLDLGDIIGVKGRVRCTPRGEITVDAEQLELLSKCLLPLPEKYHGLTDREIKYRQRYIDLIINQQSRDTFKKRCSTIATIRNVLTQDGFTEVETPMLQPIAGGAIAKPFVTHHNALDMNLFLRIAPELYLKRLLVGGLSEKVFEINRCFRNEGISTRHNPEFTTIEVYQAYCNYETVINLAEKIISSVASALHDGKQKIEYEDKILDFSLPWTRKTMTELVKEATGIDFLSISNDEDARLQAKKLGVVVDKNFGWGRVVEAVFAEKAEHLLIQPTHVTELPSEISPLAKVHPKDARLTERFETYINGWEVANGFSELNDPLVQRLRFEDQLKAREFGDEEAHCMDEDFITALEYGMPPCAGLGIGIDRLVMLMTNSMSIRDVIAFPTLKQKL